MSRLNPWKVRIVETVNRHEFVSEIQILPAPEMEDHNWKAHINGGTFFWSTKKTTIENLKRIYGHAKEL